MNLNPIVLFRAFWRIERWARAALENKFWRMYMGEEPACPGVVGEFVADLRDAWKLGIPAGHTPERALAVALLKITRTRYSITPNAIKNYDQVHRELRRFLSGKPVYQGEWTDSYGSLGKRDPLVEYYHIPPSWPDFTSGLLLHVHWLHPVFVRSLATCHSEGIGAVMHQIPPYPERLVRQLPAWMYPPSLRLWLKLHNDPMKQRLQSLYGAVSRLRPFKGDTAVDALLARCDQLLSTAESGQDLSPLIQELGLTHENVERQWTVLEIEAQLREVEGEVTSTRAALQEVKGS